MAGVFNQSQISYVTKADAVENKSTKVKVVLIMNATLITCLSSFSSFPSLQVDTDESLLLGSRQAHAYSWRTPHAVKECPRLHVCIETEGDWRWSEPFDIDTVGVFSRTIHHRLHSATLFIEVKQLSGMQKQVRNFDCILNNFRNQRRKFCHFCNNTTYSSRSSSAALIKGCTFENSLKTLEGSFLAAALKLWNELSRDIRKSNNINRFKRSPKTHLFRKSLALHLIDQLKLLSHFIVKWETLLQKQMFLSLAVHETCFRDSKWKTTVLDKQSLTFLFSGLYSRKSHHCQPFVDRC